MKLRQLFPFAILFIYGFTNGQEDAMSRADVFFYEYAYQDAIQEYKKEMSQRMLTNKQFLNLADSYFKTGNFKGASDTYFEVYKIDSTMST